MTDEKLLTVRDVSLLLGVSEREVLDLAESGKIPAYKVGGVYLRFKHEQVENYRKSHPPLLHKAQAKENYSLREKFSDFFYFNDFYIISIIAIALIILIIFRG